MTRARRATALILAAVLFLNSALESRADWVPGNYMIQALGRMMAQVLKATNESGVGYDDGVSIMAAFLQPKESITFKRPVVAGNRYIVAGGGDDDVKDLDIEILDEDGNKLASDVGADNQPVAAFDAKVSGNIVIRQRLYTAARGSFCVVSVLRSGGWKVPKDNLIKAASNIIVAGQAIDGKTEQKVEFLAGNNQWALYGGVYPSGTELTINKLAFGTGRRVFTSAGDTTARDIDLFVTVGAKEFKDDAGDATPLVDIQAGNVTDASLRIKNANSDGPCLILTTVLQLR